MSLYPQSIDLAGVGNARELGGYTGADGRAVRPGLLLRTAKLSAATPADLGKLTSTYHLSAVLDLRTAAEIAADPDPAIPGVEHRHVPILNEGAGLGASVTGIYQNAPSDRAGSLIAMVRTGLVDPDMYTAILDDPVSLSGFRDFFRILLEHPPGRAVLWHCTGGKDRTGAAAVLLLSALGVDRETALGDFALTNVYAADAIETMGAAARDRGESDAVVRGVRGLTGVNRAFMESALDHIDAKFGSMDGFLTRPDGLALTGAALARLRDKYLQAR